MKLHKNFDTKIAEKLYNKYAKDFPDGKVLLIGKSRRYYNMFILFPWFLFIIYFVLGYIMLFSMSSEINWITHIFVGLTVIILCFLLNRTYNHYVNYKMDFMIVTPHEIIKYDQAGLWTRSIEKIHANKLKRITVVKSGVLNSMLDLGVIDFLVEGDADAGDISMSYVFRADFKERQIKKILGLA